VRTPNLRRKTVHVGVLAVAALLLLFSFAVYGVLAATLNDSLREVLDNRTELAVELATELPLEEAAEQLTEMGVPATITSATGESIVAEPASPRSGVAPPSPAGLTAPVISRTTVLADGTLVEVFGTRAGVERTLRWLAAALVVGVLVGVLAAYLLLHRLVNQTLAPLAEVASTAERISDGELDQRLRPDDPDTPLGRMAVAFDRMVDSLEEAVAAEAEEKERHHRFLADAAHQLRTPITGIRGSVELLLRTEDPEIRDELIASTVRETARAGKVVSSLLHVARLDRGRPPDLKRIDLEELVHAEAARATDLSPHLEILTVTAPADVDAEAREIAEALGNLIDNARRHARTQVHIGLSATSQHAVVTVSDDGNGVAAGTERLIFDRFTTMDGEGGTGLGLPIARGVAHAHGGDLIHEERQFVLRLPLASDGAA
jgi:two-component system, OmpR family, sensor kinase